MSLWSNIWRDWVRNSNAYTLYAYNTFNSMSPLLVDENEVPGEIHRHAANLLQAVSYNVVPSTPLHERESNAQR